MLNQNCQNKIVFFESSTLVFANLTRVEWGLTVLKHFYKLTHEDQTVLIPQ